MLLLLLSLQLIVEIGTKWYASNTQTTKQPSFSYNYFPISIVIECIMRYYVSNMRCYQSERTVSLHWLKSNNLFTMLLLSLYFERPNQMWNIFSLSENDWFLSVELLIFDIFQSKPQFMDNSCSSSNILTLLLFQEMHLHVPCAMYPHKIDSEDIVHKMKWSILNHIRSISSWIYIYLWEINKNFIHFSFERHIWVWFTFFVVKKKKILHTIGIWPDENYPCKFETTIYESFIRQLLLASNYCFVIWLYLII